MKKLEDVTAWAMEVEDMSEAAATNEESRVTLIPAFDPERLAMLTMADPGQTIEITHAELSHLLHACLFDVSTAGELDPFSDFGEFQLEELGAADDDLPEELQRATAA